VAVAFARQRIAHTVEGAAVGTRDAHLGAIGAEIRTVLAVARAIVAHTVAAAVVGATTRRRGNLDTAVSAGPARDTVAAAVLANALLVTQLGTGLDVASRAMPALSTRAHSIDADTVSAAGQGILVLVGAVNVAASLALGGVAETQR